MSPSFDVAVVGGGVAGLSAATALCERGARVAVFEARHVLGGRVASFADPSTKAPIDNGPHILMGCYDESLRFLRRIGSASRLSHQSSLSMDVVDRVGRSSRLECPRLPAPVHLLAGLFTWDALRLRDSATVLRMAHRPPPRVGESAAHWLRRLGQSARVVEMLWEPLALAALNQPTEVAAADPFAEVLDRMLRRRADSALAIPTVPLEDLVAKPASEWLRGRGAAVHTSSLARVSFVPGGAPRLEVRRQPVRARAIVVAVEWHALGRVFCAPPAPLEPVLRAAAATPGEGIASAHLWFDQPVLPARFIGFPGRDWHWAFGAPPACVPGGPGALVSMVASAAGSLVSKSNEAVSASALQVLTSAVPDAGRARMVRAMVVRERRATFSLAPDMPPRPGHDVGIPGLFLAGDWIGSRLPATIEAAAASGHRAAESVARHLGL